MNTPNKDKILAELEQAGYTIEDEKYATRMTVAGYSLQFNFTTKTPKMMLTHGDTLIDDEDMIRGIIEDTNVFKRGFDIVFPEGFEDNKQKPNKKHRTKQNRTRWQTRSLNLEKN